MHAEDRMLGVIFVGSIRLMVPLFQRPYVWNQEYNWEPLWESLTAAFDRRMNATPRPHFMGAIVLNQEKSFTGEVGTRQVIDGQQRLTTLQIMLAAIRDIAAVKGSVEYQEAFKRLSENYVPSKKDPDCVYKVWPTNKDREHFKNVMTAGSLDCLLEIYNAKHHKSNSHPIPDCYRYFYQEFETLLAPHEGTKLSAQLDVLYRTIHDDLVLVVVDLDEKDDPQLIFETLNALGTPLLPADLVKNFLFYHLSLHNDLAEELYDQYWKVFDDNADYWRAERRQGRLKRHRIDLFLAHYLTLLKKDIISMPHLFGEFREYWLASHFDAKQEIAKLRMYADVFEGFEQYSPQSREGLFFSRLNDLDTNMVMPVLLEVLRSPKSEADKLQFIEYLESYLVRRAVCGLTTKNYNRIFIDLIKHLESTEYSSQALCEYLLSREGESSEWPDDKRFCDSFTLERAYKRLKESRVRMILEAIENALRDNKTEQVTINEQLTIEHIMPQNWVKNWPIGEDADGSKEELRKGLLHTFGNLSLVTKRLNPALSDAPWPQKKNALLEHSVLKLNRQLHNIDQWDEKHIYVRSVQLFEVAKNIWPRPENQSLAQSLRPSSEIPRSLKAETRVYLLAKELGVPSKAIIEKCQAEGIEIATGHMSPLTAGQAAKVRGWFSGSESD